MQDNELRLIDKIIDACPELKDKKNFIIQKLTEGLNQQKIIKQTNEYIVIKFDHDGKSFYRDHSKSNKIWDSDLNIVGFFTTTNDQINYYFYDKNYNKTAQKMELKK
jgi:hypothetical protein